MNQFFKAPPLRRTCSIGSMFIQMPQAGSQISSFRQLNVNLPSSNSSVGLAAETCGNCTGHNFERIDRTNCGGCFAGIVRNHRAAAPEKSASLRFSHGEGRRCSGHNYAGMLSASVSKHGELSRRVPHGYMVAEDRSEFGAGPHKESADFVLATSGWVWK